MVIKVLNLGVWTLHQVLDKMKRCFHRQEQGSHEIIPLCHQGNWVEASLENVAQCWLRTTEFTSQLEYSKMANPKQAAESGHPLHYGMPSAKQGSNGYREILTTECSPQCSFHYWGLSSENFLFMLTLNWTLFFWSPEEFLTSDFPSKNLFDLSSWTMHWIWVLCQCFTDIHFLVPINRAPFFEASL